MEIMKQCPVMIFRLNYGPIHIGRLRLRLAQRRQIFFDVCCPLNVNSSKEINGAQF